MNEEKVKILLCEDDENLGMVLKEYLDSKDYEVDLFLDGEEGYDAFLRKKYDFCLLDVVMPKKNGFSLAADIRARDPEVPIIFLTAKSKKKDVLQGFKIEVDDYVAKPFSMEELIYRIDAVLRRVRGRNKQEVLIYKIGDFVFDKQKQELSINGKVKKLTTKESGLLVLLAEAKNRMLDRSSALKNVWLDANGTYTRSMDVYITKLRKLLKADPNVSIINVHGRGYKLIVPQEQE